MKIPIPGFIPHSAKGQIPKAENNREPKQREEGI